MRAAAGFMKAAAVSLGERWELKIHVHRKEWQRPNLSLSGVLQTKISADLF